MTQTFLCKIGGPAPSCSQTENDGELFPPWRYGAVYERQTPDGCGRLCIGADENQVDLLIALMEQLREPLFVLYVLHTPVAGYEAGRYQGPLATREEIGVFLAMHEKFLELDGRHDCWIARPFDDGPEQLVYDSNNLIYAYGPLERFETVLQSKGYAEGTLRHPVPHSHYYHHQLNSMGDDLMAYWKWTHMPLQSGDGE